MTHNFLYHDFNKIFFCCVQICKVCKSVAVVIPATQLGLGQPVLSLSFDHGHVERAVTLLHIYFTCVSVVCLNVLMVNVSSEGACKT